MKCYKLFRFYCIRQWRATLLSELWSDCSGLCFRVTALEASGRADGRGREHRLTTGREISLEMTINSSINTSPSTVLPPIF